MPEQQKALLEDLCEQCHEHLRDADRKRDQLIAFFTVVVGVLVAVFVQKEGPID